MSTKYLIPVLVAILLFNTCTAQGTGRIFSETIGQLIGQIPDPVDRLGAENILGTRLETTCQSNGQCFNYCDKDLDARFIGTCHNKNGQYVCTCYFPTTCKSNIGSEVNGHIGCAKFCKGLGFKDGLCAGGGWFADICQCDFEEKVTGTSLLYDSYARVLG